MNNIQPKLYKHISKIYSSDTDHKEHRKKKKIIKPLELENSNVIFYNRILRNKTITNNTPNKQLVKSHIYTRINSIYKKVTASSPKNYTSIYSKDTKPICKNRKGPCIYKNNMKKIINKKPENKHNTVIGMSKCQSTNSLLNNFNTNIKRKIDNNDNYFNSKPSINSTYKQTNTNFYKDTLFLNTKEFLNKAAIMIQSNYRGYIFRFKLCKTLNKIDKIVSIFDILYKAFYQNRKNLWKQFLLILKKKTKLLAEKKFYNEFVINNKNACELSKMGNINISEFSLSNNYSIDNCISFNFLKKQKNCCFYLAEQLIKERDGLKKELNNIIIKINELRKELKKYENDDIKLKLRDLILKKIEDSKKNFYFYKFYYKTVPFKDEIEIKINKKYHLKNIFNIIKRKKKEILMKFFYKFLYNGKIFGCLVNSMNSMKAKKYLKDKNVGYFNSESKIEKRMKKDN